MSHFRELEAVDKARSRQSGMDTALRNEFCCAGVRPSRAEAVVWPLDEDLTRPGPRGQFNGSPKCFNLAYEAAFTAIPPPDCPMTLIALDKV
jgi:hypothetical protein